MEFERITAPAHPLYAEAIDLYKMSFPPHEQRESASQEEILSHPAYHFTAVCDGGVFVGEALYWDIGGARYMEHLCVSPAMRNRRYGQKILEALRDKPLILEIDPPVDDISRRRRGFYERCGFVENPYYHVHPPYHKGNDGHELVVMSCPAALTPDEYAAFRDALENTVMAQVY